MKKNTMLFFSLIVSIFFVGCSGNQTQKAMQNVLTTEWQAYTQDKTNFSGGLAMQVISPKGEFFVSTGMGEDMSNTTHFRAASCTKTFTAAAIMLLSEQGKLNIDDKITDNIPGTSTPYIPATSDFDIPYKSQITIKMLLMHRAGVFDVANQSDPGTEINYLDYILTLDPSHQLTFDELVRFVATNHLSNSVPDTEYHYSDTGYSILGKIIERVADKPYAEYIQDNLFTLNNLDDSVMVVDSFDQELPVPYISGYRWDGSNSTDVTKGNMSPHVAEGSITTTPKDLTNWIYKLMKSQAGLSSTTVEMMKSGLPSGGGSTYGLGISNPSLVDYGHAGAHAGYLTLMYYRPETDTAYVLFSNIWNMSDGATSLYAQIAAMQTIADKVITAEIAE